MDKKVFKALEKKFKAVELKLAEAQKENASKKELLKITKSLKKHGKLLSKFEERVREKSIQTTLSKFKNFLIENKSSLEDIAKNKTGEVEFVVKVVGAVTTGSGSDVTTAPVNMHTELGGFNLRNDSDLLNLCTVTQTDKDSHKYTELTPKDGDYTFVAEGGTKPQVDFKWENRFETPRKAAAYEILTEESVTDVSRLMTIAEEYLRKKHDLFKVNGIFFGDGAGENPTGATVYGRTFVAGAMALKVTKPNFMDTINAISTDIFTTQNYADESHYMPNITMINPVDFYLELVSAKDENGLPLYPQAGLFNRVNIGGMTIIPWIKIPAGKVLVADMKKYNVSNYVPFSIRIGWINDQFITNQFTMLGESRFFGYVKNLDKQAFVYDTIATVKTAITAL